MIPCPNSGALRAALDGERPDVAAHLAQCASCQDRTAALEDDVAFAASKFAAPAAVAITDVDAALARVRARTAEPSVTVLPRRRLGAGMLRAAASLAAVVLVGGMLATSGGRAAAASWLERFRAEQVAAVPVDFAAVDPSDLEALVGLADIQGLDDLINPERVADLDAAADIAGFTATPLDRERLPGSVTGPTEVLAQAPQSVRITFHERPDVPAEIRGATLVLQVPGAVVQAVGDPGDGAAMLRGEAGALQVDVEGGPSLGAVREALLSLPGLPEETVDALRAIEDWETTLPLPVPVGEIVWSETTVNGQPALAFGDESGLGSALVWNDGEHFVGVAGTVPLSQVRNLAEGGG